MLPSVETVLIREPFLNQRFQVLKHIFNSLL
jgi:hypothetical protein